MNEWCLTFKACTTSRPQRDSDKPRVAQIGEHCRRAVVCLCQPYFVCGFLGVSGSGLHLGSLVFIFCQPAAAGSRLLVMFFPLWMVGVARVTELLCTWSSSYSLLVRVLLFLCATVCLIVLVVDTYAVGRGVVGVSEANPLFSQWRSIVQSAGGLLSRWCRAGVWCRTPACRWLGVLVPWVAP
jgi:hypothetical protein